MSRDPGRQSELELSPYFHEGWTDILDLTGPEAVRCLKRYALLVFKPEAIVGRRMRTTLRFLEGHHLQPVGMAQFRHTRHTVVNLRTYSSKRKYSPNWMRLANMIYPSMDTLLLALRDDGPEELSDASGRLTHLKVGSEQGRPEGLRDLLRSPNEALNFVHSPDEPADLVREIGLLLDRSARRTLIRQVTVSGEYGTVLRTAEAAILVLERSSPSHDLSFMRSVARVDRVQSLGYQNRRRLVDAADRGLKLSWDELTSMIDPATVDAWDFAAIGSATLNL